MDEKESAVALQAIGQVFEDMFGQNLANKYPAQPVPDEGLTCYSINLTEAPNVTIKLYARDDIKPWDQAAWGTLTDWIGHNGYYEDIANDNITVYNPTDEEVAAAFDGSTEPFKSFIDSVYEFGLKGTTSAIYEKVDDPKGFLRNTFEKMARSFMEIYEGDELYARFRLLRFARSRGVPLTPAPLILAGTLAQAMAYLGAPENAGVLQEVQKHLNELLE